MHEYTQIALPEGFFFFMLLAEAATSLVKVHQNWNQDGSLL